MSRLRFVNVVLVEVCIIIGCVAFLFFRSVHEREKPPVYVTPLSSLNYKQIPTSNFQYYYEVQPSSLVEERPPWGRSSVRHVINSQGQNDPYEHQIVKNAPLYRIITMGDSFTFGQYVPLEKNYPSRLQSVITQSMTCGLTLDVINAGVPGYDIQYAVENYRRHGKLYQPDLILWLLKDDDFLDIQELTWIEKGTIERDASMSGKTKEYEKEKGVFFPEVMAVEKLHARYSKLEILSMQRSYLDLFASLYRGRLVIFTFRSMKSEYKDVLRAFAENRPNTWIADTLTYKATPGWAFPDGHPTASGYEHMTHDMMSYLRASRILPCAQ